MHPQYFALCDGGGGRGGGSGSGGGSNSDGGGSSFLKRRNGWTDSLIEMRGRF